VALDSENLITTAASIFSLCTDRKKSAAESSEDETRDPLINGIVEEMDRGIAPLDQPFEALLPGGKLEPLSARALSGQWGILEEEAEKPISFPKTMKILIGCI
jgi:hypothetical protein